MSVTIDPTHTWRSAALSRFPVATYTVSNPRVARAEPAGIVERGGPAGLKTWIETGMPYRPPVDIATAAMRAGQIRLHTELCDLSHRSGLASAAQQTVVMDYDYRKKDTICETRSDGEHIPVLAGINLSLLERMDTSASIDAVSKDIGLKLPRLTASNTGAQGPQGALAYNELESSRYFLVRAAQQDDYGLRLHNLAKVVCHALVADRLQLRGKHTVEMNRGRFGSVLTAELASLQYNVLEESSWFYIADDLSPEYRAFLTMAAKGVWHYVSPGTETIYSRCVSEVEVGLSDKPINFVRRSGNMAAPQPPAAAFVRVLASPSLAAACYYAYADSLGIGLEASQVLLQTMFGPHFWGKRAYLPYKALHPKTDAAVYLLRNVSSVARLSLGDLNHMLGDMAILSTRVMAGLGSVLTSYTCDKKVAMPNVVAAMVGLVTDPSAAKSLLLQVHSHVNAGYAGLEWVECFRQDTDAAFDRAVTAYKLHHGLLTQYYKAPVSILKGLLFSGVEMSNEVPGSKYSTVPYIDLVVYQIMGSGVLSVQSEQLTSADLANVHMLGAVSAWRALYSWVRYSPVSVRSSTPASENSTGSEPIMVAEVYNGPSMVRFPEVPTTSTGPGGQIYPRAQTPQAFNSRSPSDKSSDIASQNSLHQQAVAGGQSNATTRPIPTAGSAASTVVGATTKTTVVRPVPLSGSTTQTAAGAPHAVAKAAAPASPTIPRAQAVSAQPAAAKVAVQQPISKGAPVTKPTAPAGVKSTQQPAARTGTPTGSPQATRATPTTPPDGPGTNRSPQSPNSSGSSGTAMSTSGLRL